MIPKLSIQYPENTHITLTHKHPHKPPPPHPQDALHVSTHANAKTLVFTKAPHKPPPPHPQDALHVSTHANAKTPVFTKANLAWRPITIHSIRSQNPHCCCQFLGSSHLSQDPTNSSAIYFICTQVPNQINAHPNDANSTIVCFGNVIQKEFTELDCTITTEVAVLDCTIKTRA